MILIAPYVILAKPCHVGYTSCHVGCTFAGPPYYASLELPLEMFDIFFILNEVFCQNVFLFFLSNFEGWAGVSEKLPIQNSNIRPPNTCKIILQILKNIIEAILQGAR